MSSNPISDERVEVMVLPPNVHLWKRSWFLKPTLSLRASTSDRPSKPISTISSLPAYLQQAKFTGWVDPKAKWHCWVDSMKVVHGQVWQTLGIYDAIMNSLVRIPQNKSLILWFAEKWSPTTNTFIFPWGEVTITLEDMMVLGGFSVLGGPVTCHVERPEDCVALEKLIKAYTKIIRTPSKKASFNAWMVKFMCRQKAYEHEAFLVLWLSKYLFGSVKNTISPDTFHLAILLARGRKTAMGPAVLATLYRDLHILKNAILDVQQGVAKMILQDVYSPIYYIQIWVWERFPCVRPRYILNAGRHETRLGRWAELCNKDMDYGSLELKKEHFVWRPYVRDTNHFITHKVYNEIESLREIDNEEVESFARCLRACTLVGLDVHQHYFPHRVSRQFGYSQDIPPDIILVELEDEDAWADYCTPLSTANVYIPSKEIEGYPTKRYEAWLQKEPVSPASPRVPVPPKRRHKKVGAKFL